VHYGIHLYFVFLADITMLILLQSATCLPTESVAKHRAVSLVAFEREYI